MNVAEILVDSLAREGTEVIFGMPGVQIMEILDAVYKHEEIRWITPRHEQTAGYMALGYARTTGREGIAVVVPGPGVLNVTAAIGTAYATSTPVLLIAGQIESANIGKNSGSLHEMDDQLDVLKPITKWHHRISDITTIPGYVKIAFAEMRTGRQRPVELEIPLDFLPSSAETSMEAAINRDIFESDLEHIDDAVVLLRKSEYPLIIAGGGVISSGASDGLTRLAEIMGAPVVTTDEGKGSIDERHSLALGSANPAVNKVLAMADLFLVIGSRMAPRRSQQLIKPGEKVIQIDIDPDEIGKNYTVDVGIEADARKVISAIVDELQGNYSSKWEISEIQSIKEKSINELKYAAPLQVTILQAIREAIGDGILIPDVTNLGYWCQTAYPVYEPRTYMSSSYFGTLGYAFPTALGAKVGNPDKPVMAVCGDGGFLYAAPELATAVQEKINVVTLVLCNDSYGTCEKIQKNRFESRIIGTRLLNPDFRKLAESFGAIGIALQNVDELQKTLQEAFKEDLPVVIELPVTDTTNPWEIVR